MRKTLLVAMLLAAVGGPAVIADHYSDLYIVPVAARVSGSLGTVWVSDLAIQNFQTTPLTLNILFIESGEGNPENVANLVSTSLPTGSATVPAGGSVILRDVLDGFEGRHENLIGALIVSADRAFALTSRAYGTAAFGTFGQTVVPVRDFIDNTLGNTDNTLAVAYVPGLTSNATFRSNLGFVAGAGATGMTIQVTLKGADGATLGTRNFSVAPSSFVHLQFSTQVVTAANFDAGAAEYRITAGDGAVAPYASIIDNRTADAVFVGGVFPANAAFKGGRSAVLNLFRRLVDSMKQ